MKKAQNDAFMKQNGRKKTPNTGGRRFFWKSGFNAKVPKIVCTTFGVLVVVGPFSTEDPKKKEKPTHSRAARKNATTAVCSSRQRSKRRRERTRTRNKKKKQQNRIIRRRKRRKKKKSKKAKKAKKNKEGEEKRSRRSPIRGRTGVS